jgi:iron complex transport system substrate-binding protein
VTLTIERPTYTPADDGTRREFVLGGLLLGTLLLAGCGDSESSSPDPSAARDGFPVTITHKYGSTQIPTQPKRVVSLGFTDHDALLALGVTPVALGADESSAGQRFGVWPWAHDKLGDAKPEVLSYTEINIEKVAALRPDLITGFSSGMTKQEYALLSKIAPTVAQSKQYADYFAPWQEVVRTAGRVLGRTAQANELVQKVDAGFARAREQHPEFAGASAVYAGVLGDGQYYAESPTGARVAILTSLGFTIPQAVVAAARSKFYVTVSQERLDLLDHDVLVWEIGDSKKALAAIEDSEIYQQLEVAREGRDVFVQDPILAGAMALISVLSLQVVLDRLVPMLATALDGDPATR